MTAVRVSCRVSLVALLASIAVPERVTAQVGSVSHRCSLTVVSRVRLQGPGARPWSEFSLPAVLRLSTGQFLVAPAGDPGSVELYAADGVFVRRVGRWGSGPGEFQLPGPLMADGGDSVYVFDRQLRRISVFTPRLAFVRSVPLPIGRVGGATMAADGKFWVQGALGTPEGVGMLVHLVDKRGVVTRSVAPFPGSLTPATNPGSLLREIAALPAGVAVTPQSDVQVELWNSDGTRGKRLASRPSWFLPWSSGESGDQSHGVPIRNFVSGIRSPDGATIWIHVLRPRDGRTSLWVPPNWAGLPGGERPPVPLPALLRKFRAEVAVVDIEGDQIVASIALDEPYLPGVAGGTLFRLADSGESAEELEVLVLALRPHATAKGSGRCSSH